ncbi:MAG: hypothetical protein D9V47_01380 [Clostridia bacterium]|nr:MAG: hypothetical protein D9V47_01380 [Clostridia bacterium]
MVPVRVLRAVLDILAAAVAWHGAGVPVFSLGAGNVWWALPASLAVWPLVLLFFGVYSQQRLRSVKLGFTLLVQALAVYLGLVAAMIFFLRLPVDRSQYLYTLPPS